MMEKIGPVQLLAIGFGPDAKFEGRIMDELSKLERQETIRILDLLFVQKDAETGDLLALDYQGKELGAIVGTLLGFEFEDDSEQRVASREVKSDAFGLSRRQLGRLRAHRARVGAQPQAGDPRNGRIPSRGGLPYARGGRRRWPRARRHGRGPR
jgi:hypothetical protein